MTRFHPGDSGCSFLINQEQGDQVHGKPEPGCQGLNPLVSHRVTVVEREDQWWSMWFWLVYHKFTAHSRPQLSFHIPPRNSNAKTTFVLFKVVDWFWMETSKSFWQIYYFHIHRHVEQTLSSENAAAEVADNFTLHRPACWPQAYVYIHPELLILKYCFNLCKLIENIVIPYIRYEYVCYWRCVMFIVPDPGRWQAT